FSFLANQFLSPVHRRTFLTMPTTASIELLSSDVSLPRSSHSLALIQNALYILGGEVQPREPARPFLHIFDMNGIYPIPNDNRFIYGSLKPLQLDSSPALRVGAASVVVDDRIYVWGGRGGKSMSALDEGGRF